MPSDSTPQPSELETPESRFRAFIARFFTVGLVLIVPAMVIQIGFRWATVHEPTTALLLSGDGSLDGARIVVTSMSDANWSQTTSLDQAGGWQAPVLLDPGKYHVVVTHRGYKILDDDCEPNRMMGVRFELPSMVTIIGDKSLANTKIEIQRRGDNSIAYDREIRLTAVDGYREPIHLHSGEYRAIASNNSGELSRQNFTVDRTERVLVDFRPRAPGDGN